METQESADIRRARITAKTLLESFGRPGAIIHTQSMRDSYGSDHELGILRTVIDMLEDNRLTRHLEIAAFVDQSEDRIRNEQEWHDVYDIITGRIK